MRGRHIMAGGNYDWISANSISGTLSINLIIIYILVSCEQRSFRCLYWNKWRMTPMRGIFASKLFHPKKKKERNSLGFLDTYTTRMQNTTSKGNTFSCMVMKGPNGPGRFEASMIGKVQTRWSSRISKG